MHKLIYIVGGGEDLKSFEKLIVANTGNDSLTFIDLCHGGQSERFDLKDGLNYGDDHISFHSSLVGPYDLEYSGKEYIYCTGVYDDSVIKINLKTRKIVDIIPVGKHPSCIKYFDQQFYIVNSDSNSISVIDEKDFVLAENIQVGENPVDLEIDKINKKIYVANGNGYSIDVIDLNGEGRDHIKLSNNPAKMIIDENMMYILSNVNNGVLNRSNLSVINLDTYEEKNIRHLKGIFSNMLKINGSEIIFITNMEDGYLFRMDIKRKNLLSKTQLKGMPNKLCWDGDNILFISNMFTNMITVFDIKNNKVIDNIEVGKEPNGILLFS